MRGDSFRLSPEVTAQVLFPPAAFDAKAADDKALVIRLEIAGKFHVLLLSDTGQKTEEKLLAAPNELESDIVIKGRHYSGELDSELFLAALRPQVIVASSVPFPARERVPDDWAAAVRARGTKLFRQDETGAVKLRFFDDHWTAGAFLDGETFRSPNR
ncbi:MAG: hypothetical protein ABI233_07840 [Chthoniobacterales bacterium]